MNIIDFKDLVYTQGFEPFFSEYTGNIKLKDFIYHYTSQYVLSEILNRKEVWLSHALDMNDPGEIFFGIEVIIDILSESLHNRSKVLKYIIEENDNLLNYNRFVDLNPHFVLSLSEKKDDLKQWVHYADNANGISIEFILSKIIDTITTTYPNELCPLLMPVNYFYKNKKSACEKSQPFVRFVNNFFVKIDEVLETNDFEINFNFKKTVFDYVVLFASLIKQNLYSEEKEWRLVISTGIGDEKIKTKIIDNIAQMKLVLSLDEKSILNIINSVMIGPKNYRNVTNEKALELLVRQKLDGCFFRIAKSSGEIN